MDVLLATVAGVGVRGILYSLDELFGNATPVLIGLWEGLAIHQLSRLRRHSSSDHYLAYALRSLADILIFGNIQRIVFIGLWTSVSVISAEAINPVPPSRSRSSRSTRHKTSRSGRIRAYETMERPQHRVQIRNNSPPRLVRTEVPTTRASQPGTPPSFYLQGGESEAGVLSPSTPLPIVDESEEDQELEEEESAVTEPIFLPPPPEVAPEQRDQELARHLYTIEEASLEVSRDEFAALGEPAPYAPSIATTIPVPVPVPAPVPNPTYLHHNSSQVHLGEPPLTSPDESFTDSGPPVVVPNSTLQYTSEGQFERPLSPGLSEGGDPLLTPGAPAWALDDDHDPLQTPIQQLSPVFSERQKLADFDPMSTPPQVIIPPPSSRPAPSMIHILNSATTSVTTTVTGSDSVPGVKANGNGNGTTAPVEYFSPIALLAPSKPPPDEDTVSETNTETDETVISVLSNGNSKALYARAEALRDEANKMEKKRVKLNKDLDKAKNGGDTRRILFLKEEVRVAEMEVKKLHERAVRRFIKARNSEGRPQVVDVHGLKVPEAIQTTERALRQAFTMGYPSVNIIVGKGLHSAGGKPVLKQAIQRHLEGQLNMTCQIHPKNEGVLVCEIPQEQS